MPLPSVSTSTVERLSANSADPLIVTGPAVTTRFVMLPLSTYCRLDAKPIDRSAGVGSSAPGSSTSGLPSPSRSKALAQSSRAKPAAALL
ncbi:hypothetical protein [Rhodoplanes sp. Z2-YC6860]|uniref:hypothetical protein n=1 Tax=Rhodoplanes sp. Z2-YC6860 TaxID=674703 RepID=UPI0012ECBF6F|nr:hypothetical protein [Rhodoplanes sp. Z2-YC6860]